MVITVKFKNMFGFFIKKTFFDGWDNLFNLVLVNIVCLLSALLLGGLIAVFYSFPLILAGLILLFFVTFGIFSTAYGKVAADIANYKGVHIGDFFKAIPSSFKDGALFGLLCGLIGIISVVAMRFYLREVHSIIGFLLAAFLFWIDVIFFLSFQWFVAIRSLMHNDFKKCLKKCFLIFFDNTGFSILMGLYTLVCLLLSFFCVGFIPSLAGIVLAQTNALRLRLYKYDYLEQHPELTTPSQRRQIPWEELIYEDRETLGPHKLKQMFFPWKI